MAPAVPALDMLLVHGCSRRRFPRQRVLPVVYAELLDWYMAHGTPQLVTLLKLSVSCGMCYAQGRACGRLAPKFTSVLINTLKLEGLTGAPDSHMHPEAAATARREPKDGAARVSVAGWSRRRRARMHMQRACVRMMLETSERELKPARARRRDKCDTNAPAEVGVDCPDSTAAAVRRE